MLKRRIVYTIVFLQFFLLNSFAVGSLVKEECILIINANSDLSPLSNHIISELIYKLPVEYKGTTISSENLNLMRIYDEQRMDTIRRDLFAKYENSVPKLIIIMGGNTWALIHEELEKRWKDIPVILFTEKSYTGPVDAYLQKTSITREEQIPLRNIIKGRNMTLVYAPFYVKETIDLMYQQIPDMNRLIFISDRRWFSAQNRQEVAETVVKYFPDLQLRFFTEGQENIEEVIGSLKQADKNTGILYAAWESYDSSSTNVALLPRTYKRINQYSAQPVFALTDMIGQTGLVGGYFSLSKDISKTIADISHKILSGIKASDIPATKVNAGPVFNYEELLRAGLYPELCPPNTFFYYKPVSFIEKNKYILATILLCVLFGIIILLVRIYFLSNIRKMQSKQIQLMSNYNNLFNDMPVLYLKCRLIKDEDGKVDDYVISDVNPSFERHFYKKEDALNKRGSVLNSSEVFAKLKEYMGMADQERKPVSFSMHAMNGHNYDVLVMVSNLPGVVNVFCMDTTELIHTRQSLRTINHKLSMALGIADITPWRWNLKEDNVWFDKSKLIENDERFVVKEGAFAVSISQIMKRIHSEDIKRVKKLFQELKDGKREKVNEQFRVLTASKEDYDWIEVWAVVDEKDGVGKPLAFIGSVLDITDRKKMEQELVVAKEKAEEANRLKSAFIANISHEIRTPLNAIIGFSSILDTVQTDKERKEYLHIIEHNNQLLLQLVNDIIDLSKIEAGALELVASNVYLDDMMRELERVFRPKANAAHLSLKFDDQHAECYVNADRNRLIQVLNNLISNAIKFTAEGSVHFGFSRLDNGMLRFYVTDTGHGIPKEYQKKIFGRFVKLNSFVQGIGLGLSIGETIVKCMGGEIGVESKEGRGSTFWFTIPYQEVNLQ